MGMYTELVCAFELKEETPDKIIDIINFMCDDDYGLYTDLPEHELFETTRWKFMLRSDSYYFEGSTNSTIEHDSLVGGYYVTIRCNLKNYDNEIEKFIDWISEYIRKDDYFRKQFIGYKRYEENDDPTLIYV
jgi:hypothetical protein